VSEESQHGAEHIDQHVYLHLVADKPIRLTFEGPITINLITTPKAPPAVRAQLTLGEKPVPGQFTVDTVGQTVTLGFTDDKGDTNAPAPAGLDPLVWSSDSPAVTVANDATNPLVGDITVVAEGSANISVGPLTVAGAPLTEADGSAFPAPAAAAVTVTAGAAVGDALVLSS
jgi:hypothetical protein